MRRESGVTLIEMLVTLLISGVFLLIVGFVMVNANIGWIKMSRNIMLQDDMRYARRRITWLVRNADSSPFIVNDERNCITFNKADRIMSAGDGTKRVLYVPATGSQEVILPSADVFTIYSSEDLIENNKMLAVNKQGTAMFTIVASIGATNDATDEVVTSSMTFIVKNTNSGT